MLNAMRCQVLLSERVDVGVRGEQVRKTRANGRRGEQKCSERKEKTYKSKKKRVKDFYLWKPFRYIFTVVSN